MLASVFFIGAAACAACHPDATAQWSAGRHSKMLQPATAATVEGDFGKNKITLHGAAYRLRSSGGNFYITQSSQEYRVQYTLGSRRIQHYLTTLPDGRIILLAPSWDVLRKEWFHNMDIVAPEESDPGSSVQIWNKNCYSCHVSREEKNFNPETNTYKTSWQDFGTNCERCHGPGSEHATHPASKMVMPDTMTCAQCHSLRDIVAEGYSAGQNYFDFFLPLLEYAQKPGPDPAYWADGRPRRFSNDAIGFLQSECFLKGGATCENCHANLHDPRIEKNAAVQAGSNTLCASCHAEIARNAPAHSHHKDINCVECHMPRTVFSIKAAIRDHTISIPSPENTARHAIPNACGNCHEDRGSQWAVAKLDEWYGANAQRAKLVRRADISIGSLLAIVADRSEGQVVRANAIGHLSAFQTDPRAALALRQALRDPEALVRAVAAIRIESKNAAPLIEALKDPVRAVRVGAVFSLVNLGLPALSGEDRRRFDAARQEYLARADIHADDAAEQFNKGGFLLLSGDPAGAITALRASGAPQADALIRAAQKLLAQPH